MCFPSNSTESISLNNSIYNCLIKLIFYATYICISLGFIYAFVYIYEFNCKFSVLCGQICTSRVSICINVMAIIDISIMLFYTGVERYPPLLNIAYICNILITMEYGTEFVWPRQRYRIYTTIYKYKHAYRIRVAERVCVVWYPGVKFFNV